MFTASESGRSFDHRALPDALAVSVITAGELRAGVLAATDSATRVRRLDTYRRVLDFEPIPIDESIAESWATLRVLLRDAGARMAINDSWIAATAMALRVPIVTQAPPMWRWMSSRSSGSERAQRAASLSVASWSSVSSKVAA
jgi:predicted nucleic acid-binding protein